MTKSQGHPRQETPMSSSQSPWTISPAKSREAGLGVGRARFCCPCGPASPGTARLAAVLPEPQLPHLSLHGGGTEARVFSSASVGTLMAGPPRGAEVGAPGAKASGSGVSFLLLDLETAPPCPSSLGPRACCPHPPPETGSLSLLTSTPTSGLRPPWGPSFPSAQGGARGLPRLA